MRSHSDWSEAKLGDIVNLKRGYDLPKRLRKEGMVPLVSSAGTSDSHNEFKVKGPGVVTGRYGTIGQVFFIEKDFWPLNTTLYVQDFKGNDAKFIYYFLKTIKYNEYNDKAAVPGVNRNHLHLADVSIPKSILEQKAIAHILGSLDDKIKLNRQMNETLESTAQALFKSWFVDFDHVIDNALAAGNHIPDVFAGRVGQRGEINQNYRKLSENGGSSVGDLEKKHQSLFPNEFEFTEEMGWAPKGWKLSTIDNEFAVTMGQSPPGSTYNEDGNGIYFYQGSTDFGFRYPTPRIYCNAPKRLASQNDTLVSVRAPVGDTNIALDNCCIGRGLAAVRHKTGASSFTYYSMLQLKENFKIYEGEGTVFGSINQKVFKSLRQLEIGKQAVECFELTSGSIDKKIELNELEIQSLSKLRDTLLKKLLSGELRIPDAEKLIDEIKS